MIIAIFPEAVTQLSNIIYHDETSNSNMNHDRIQGYRNVLANLGHVATTPKGLSYFNTAHSRRIEDEPRLRHWRERAQRAQRPGASWALYRMISVALSYNQDMQLGLHRFQIKINGFSFMSVDGELRFVNITFAKI